eukprot:1159641-Pelagomonas_calceolata.AAC.15
MSWARVTKKKTCACSIFVPMSDVVLASFEGILEDTDLYNEFMLKWRSILAKLAPPPQVRQKRTEDALALEQLGAHWSKQKVQKRGCASSGLPVHGSAVLHCRLAVKRLY